jgi:hypothetical protein
VQRSILGLSSCNFLATFYASSIPLPASITVIKTRWLLLCLLATTVAVAHVNDRGMDYQHYTDRYGQPCCGVLDCRPADDFAEMVVDGNAVVRLLLDGRWITVPSYYVTADAATDGRAHFCGQVYVLRTSPPRVLPGPTCVILPPRST